MTKIQINKMIKMSEQLWIITDAQIQARNNVREASFHNPNRLSRLEIESKILLSLSWFFDKCLNMLITHPDKKDFKSFGAKFDGEKMYIRGGK
tara:strand:+ start:1330 stop:1608 length:279 start_codon:yes stop_codon:yes gene_type:complete